MFGKNGPTLFELIHQALCSTRRGYDLLAPKFDATPFRTPDEILAPALATLGPVPSALDLCCGTGAAMRHLRPLCANRLAGVDFSPGMLTQTREHLAAIPGAPKLDLVEADIFDLQYDSEFDVVTCFGALGHILPEDTTTFLQIVHRALRPGGRFVFVTGYPPSALSLHGIVLRTFNTVMWIRNVLIKPPFIMYYLTFLLPDIEQDLSAQGFDVEVRKNLFEPPFQRYWLVIASKRPVAPTRGDPAVHAQEAVSRT